MIPGKFISVAVMLALLATTSYAKRSPQTNAPGFALVELFTSEGCSSCPAAEAVLADVHQKYKDNVYVMEFHVDYWNYLGWEDVYSAKTYSQRQQRYVQALHLNSAYTPQAVVNGKSEVVGSNRQRLQALIDDNLGRAQTGQIQLSAKASGGNVVIAYTVANAGNAVLNIALVQKKALTDVRKGENSGKKLAHLNVVRDLKTLPLAQSSGSLSIPLLKGMQASGFTIIAWTQDKKTLVISDAAETAIN